MNNIDLITGLKDIGPAKVADKSKSASDFESFFKTFKSSLDNKVGKDDSRDTKSQQPVAANEDTITEDEQEDTIKVSSAISEFILQMSQNFPNEDVLKEISIEPELLAEISNVQTQGTISEKDMEDLLKKILSQITTIGDGAEVTGDKEALIKALVSASKALPQEPSLDTFKEAVTSLINSLKGNNEVVEAPVTLEEDNITETTPIINTNANVKLETTAPVDAQKIAVVEPIKLETTAPVDAQKIAVAEPIKLDTTQQKTPTQNTELPKEAPAKPVVTADVDNIQAVDDVLEQAIEPKLKDTVKAATTNGEKTSHAVLETVSTAKKTDVKLEGVEIKESLRGQTEEKSITTHLKAPVKGDLSDDSFLNSDKGSSDNKQNLSSLYKNDGNQFNALMKESVDSSRAEPKLQSPQQPYNLQEPKDIARLMRTLESGVSKGESKLTVTLTPENLGRLEIRLVESGGKITAKFFTDNETSHKMMVAQSEAIRNQLSDKGIVIDNMEFAFNDTSSKGGTGDERRSNRHNHNKKMFKNDENDADFGKDIATSKQNGIYA